nr:type I secretion system permease/ATPase [Roseospira goensis]
MGALRGQILVAIAFGLFVALLLAVTPLYVFQIFERVLTSRSVPTLVMLMLLAGGAMIVLAVLDWVRQAVLLRAGAALEARLTGPILEMLFDGAARAPVPGLRHATADAETVRRFVGSRAMVHLTDAPWVAVLLGLILLFNLWVFLLATGVALVMVVLALLPRAVTRRRARDGQALAIEAETRLEERLGHAQTIAAMGMGPRVQQAWRAMHDRRVRLDSSTGNSVAVFGAAAAMVHRIGVVGVLALAAWLYTDDLLSSPAVITVALLAERAFAALERLTRAQDAMLRVNGARRRLRELFERGEPARDRMPLPAPRGAVSLQQAMVAPPGARLAALKGVSLSLEPGDSLGVIGPSGSGKSVLARTLVGLWAPFQGTVRLDGNDLRNWSPEQLGEHVGYLSQEVDLMEGTVAEVIARLGPVDADAVIDAARRARVHETILRLPNGYDTAIGAGGHILPAGLRQRVALARALYGSPALVVLDEPNAFLDSDGEQALTEALKGLGEAGCTVVLITQKPALLAAVESVLVLRDGQVEMMGPRQAILSRFARPGPGGGGQLPPPGNGAGGAP